MFLALSWDNIVTPLMYHGVSFLFTHGNKYPSPGLGGLFFPWANKNDTP